MKISNDILILQDLVVKLLSRIEQLEAENAVLKLNLADLETRLNQNSKNSNKPPSTDGLKKSRFLVAQAEKSWEGSPGTRERP